MNRTYRVEVNQSQRVRCCFIFAVALMVCVAISGCTINRVSILALESSAKPVKPSEVKFYPSLKDVSEHWKLEGMISANLVPIMRNSSQNREELIRNTIAGLGINTVVGVQSLDGNGLFGLSNAILANIGTAGNENIQTTPKFIAFLPAINYKIEKDPSMPKLDDYLLEHIQHFFSYSKGYYVYYNASSGITNADILKGNIDSDVLAEPLGIAPHYALLCDVDAHKEFGTAWVYRTRTLMITLTLYDLKEKKVVWTSTTSGNAKQGYLGFAGLLTKKEETCLIIRKALTEAMDSLPKVTGFRMGPANF